ncbi:MAG TPA: nitronate monooxygenase, partial [Dehalococcoidia bacterium]|nr:nitronate monooxygenase [Dehalococcoidia bacterium]
MTLPVLRTALCDLLEIEYPILQAGMQYVARGPLAAAVSAAGGLGVIGAAGMSGRELEAEIRLVRSRTDRPFGVDIILPAGVPEKVTDDLPPDFRYPEALDDLRWELGIRRGEVPIRPLASADLIREQIEVIFDHRVPVLVSGLGNPASLVPRARELGMKVMALVGTVRAARRVAAGGADVVVAQGHEAGGHTGQVTTMILVPQVVDAVRPTLVAAAGGVADGRGLLAALMLGASGVWLGTRFIAATESHAHETWKQRVVDAASEDAQVTKYLTGKPNRSIRNRIVDVLEGSGNPPLPFPQQQLLIEDIVLTARDTGHADLMRLASGQTVGLIGEVKPAGEIIREIVAQAEAVWEERAAPVPRRAAREDRP